MFNTDNTHGYTQTELDLFNTALGALIDRFFPDYIFGTSQGTDELLDALVGHWSEEILTRYDGGTKTLAALVEAVA
jgi:hypothetical protein